MSPFVKLADPGSYLACDCDFAVDESSRNYWVSFFKRHLDVILKLGVEAAIGRDESPEQVAERSQRCREELDHQFDRFASDPRGFGRVTIMKLDQWRDGILRRNGFLDAFIDLKARENAKMLPVLPAVCAEIDLLSGEQQILTLIQGVFAGNIFDMGAGATARQFLAHSPDFFNTRSSLPDRPWLVDDYDALQHRLITGPLHRKLVFFIDNAGSDFLLGALPLIRWFAERGTEVVIAANERPTLNDLTVQELRALWPRILFTIPSLARLPITIVSTGTAEPSIDLLHVSEALNQVSAEADLVILEGMGRGVESNFDAQFNCDALNIAMLKDEWVAARVGGILFDVVCRFR
jgi:uncharacterized protein with ATP-grasp and redox domains